VRYLQRGGVNTSKRTLRAETDDELLERILYVTGGEGRVAAYAVKAKGSHLDEVSA
jgi:hypothetical protein